MGRGFYIIMAAQFFSSLADNALLVAAIALLMQADSPAWLTPYLKFFFVISYVVLAPFVGAFADRLPKGTVMFLANTIKIAGCALMLFDVNPFLAYALVAWARPPTRPPSTASSPSTCPTPSWSPPTAGSRA